MQSPKNSYLGHLANMARGFLMGGADIIPGVSGGTVALILGIYERLITAISRVDLEFLGDVRRGEFQKAIKHIDLRFLLALGCGIGLGILSLASLMNHLLIHYFEATWSVFFGLIVASAFLVGRMVERRHIGTLICGSIGAAFAYWLVGNLPAVPPRGLGYVAICGMIAICAMILPGISGAFILLIMGKYGDITASIRSLTDGTADSSTFLTLGVFAVGCGVGLLTFSKVLRWLLSRFHPQTMAILCGFLVGSLRKIWPFKNDITLDHLHAYGLSEAHIARIREDPGALAEFVKVTNRIYENTLPDALDGNVILCIVLALAAAGFVFVLDRVSGTQKDSAVVDE